MFFLHRWNGIGFPKVAGNEMSRSQLWAVAVAVAVVVRNPPGKRTTQPPSTPISAAPQARVRTRRLCNRPPPRCKYHPSLHTDGQIEIEIEYGTRGLRILYWICTEGGAILRLCCLLWMGGSLVHVSALWPNVNQIMSMHACVRTRIRFPTTYHPQQVRTHLLQHAGSTPSENENENENEGTLSTTSLHIPTRPSPRTNTPRLLGAKVARPMICGCAVAVTVAVISRVTRREARSFVSDPPIRIEASGARQGKVSPGKVSGEVMFQKWKPNLAPGV